MKVKIDPKKTALLVIDMQNDWILKEGAAAKLGFLLWQEVEKGRTIENIQRMVKVARDYAIPIFHVRTVYRRDFSDVANTVTDFSLELRKRNPSKSPKDYMKDVCIVTGGTWGSKFVDELQPEESDYVITKKRSSAFYNTDLELHLNSIGVRTLIITGIATDGCVDATVHDAESRDFNIIVLTDCTAATEEALQKFWMKSVFPKRTVTTSSKELVSTLKT
jgi:ureidoacrylate peracid hydrolase